MIDYALPHQNMHYDPYYPSTSPAPARLDDFQVFKKGTASHIYGNYYSNAPYDLYPEPEIDSAMNVYHNLVSCRDYPRDTRDDWKYKVVDTWNEDDTVSWMIDTVQYLGHCETEIPFYNFRVKGFDLRNMKREDVLNRMLHPSIDHITSRRIADSVYEKLQNRLHEEILRQSSIIKYADVDPYHSQESTNTMLDLDSLDHKNRLYTSDYTPNDSTLLHQTDSSDDTEDVFRSSETASPECSYGSDGSKSGDEDDKRKIFKRPPGRPKGSGRRPMKRPRSVSVPEFLRNLLLDSKYCPSIIKWEDHSQGKFRFVKPDEVAKLWGHMKQNENMTFEKFSRAMRYHYRQMVLVSVPTARLVYQFGHKGPDFKTDNPNFVKVKSENVTDMSYS
ncbi:ETS homologous factor-like [Spodoptera litura]|uniref:ETS homologous factor-like n=1 Tax=Spodoptera litura TaxID=69820 RepID=A0A9J7IW82_SPOLT|nr:ETS homologous factor-like [Spodoptera litura]